MEPLKIPIWKPPFRSFISCIVYRDFGTFSSKSDQGPFFVAISRLIQIKLLPCGAWSRQRPCSRSRTDPDRSLDQVDGAPEFHPLKASILELHFLHSLQGFWHIFLKIWSGALHGIMQAYPDKTPSMCTMIQTKPMFRIEDCSRSMLGSSRGGSWFW